MIDWILSLLGKVLGFFNSITGNYLLAIFLFALLFKILLVPFSIKQQKNQVKQAKLQPKVNAIRKKYTGKTDAESQQKMNQEIQEFYASEGFNAMAGCLPMLLQFPIIIALYNVIRNPLQYICGVTKDALNVVLNAVKELNGIEKTIDSLQAMTYLKGENFANVQAKVAEIAGDVDVSSFTSLAEKDLPDFSLFGLNFDLSVTPTVAFNWYLLIPILTFVTIFLSSKLTRKLSYVQQDAATGCSNWILDLSMPAMSTAFTFMFPALLGIYWMFNNLLGVLQQLVLRALFPAPKFTEEDYKEAERAMRGKSGKTMATDSRVIPGKKYVSLHHIDDDDPVDLPVLPLDSREQDNDTDDKNGSQGAEKDIPKQKDESDRPRKKKK
ncbi:MAG: YidC/Oxa1 family membrane protein insertase [Eubacteriales bacterium]